MLTAHPQRKSGLPLVHIHVCMYRHTHAQDIVYKADMSEIKRKEGLGMTAY